MKSKWYEHRWVNVSLHIAAWIFFFLLPMLLRLASGESGSTNVKTHPHIFSLSNIILNLSAVAIFYLNALLMLPRLIQDKKKVEYIVAQVVIIVLLILFWSPFSIFFYIFVIACSTTYYFIQDRIRTEQIAREKENENLKTELSLLRSQVSPHFMFNVLNNMVALARKKSDQLESSLIKLSSLMRYMLYEANEDKVPLEKEVEYLQSYIDLQKQRFGKNVLVNLNLEIRESNYYIEPMLLIPFVENAFKHGIGMVENATIDIDLSVDSRVLHFSVKNKFIESGEIKDKTSGIGLANVKRRLNLLYKHRYQLHISNANNCFDVSLEIKLI
jgi:two-component system, LytTR family, sensor kinase